LKRKRLLLMLAALALAAPMPLQANPTAPVLRVGVVDGSQPCSYREGGVWRGLAVDLWTRVANREGFPYVLVPSASIRSMLEATRRGQLDVAVECINLSPQRLRQYRFSLPFQEDGQAVMVASSPFSLGQAFLSALLGGSLLRLLVVVLLATVALSSLVWWLEDLPEKAASSRRARWQGFTRVFAVMVTGGGDNDIVYTARGRLLVMLAYLLRIIASAVLVGFLTVELVQEAQGRAGLKVNRLTDLTGLRVGFKAGTVSQTLLEEINQASSLDQVTLVPQNSIEGAMTALASKRIDAIVADELQLRYLVNNNGVSGTIPVLALSGIRPELQGFGLSPTLDEATVQRINLAISELKRSGVVQSLRQLSLVKAGATQSASTF